MKIAFSAVFDIIKRVDARVMDSVFNQSAAKRLFPVPEKYKIIVSSENFCSKNRFNCFINGVNLFII